MVLETLGDARPSLVGDADADTQRIVEALDRKRKQLDAEIADYKAQKEKEYRKYEQWLESEVRKVDRQNSGGMQGDRVTAHRRKSAHTERALEVPDNRHTNRSSVGSEAANVLEDLNEDRDAEAPRCAEESPGGSPGELFVHEREKEFEGVFTPGYLPLLDDEGRRSSDGSRRPSINPEDILSVPDDEIPVLSSSADITLPSSTPLLDQSTPISYSAPHEQELHRRRWSSRSDTSVGSLRRSSIRDPKLPRSPKRVLFNIDDTVVSPSTSPVTQRRSTAPSDKSSKKSNSKSKSEKFEIVKKKKSKKEKAPSAKAPEQNSAPIVLPKFSGNRWTKAFNPFLSSSERRAASTQMGGDDFENVDNEDLFAFDEEMDLEHGKFIKVAEAEQVPSDDETMVESKETLKGSSPHAGSLPIEIKWPQRRNDGG